MSDGPYKSLPMAPWWKKVAQAAENSAHSPKELRDLLVEAAARDIRKSLPSSLVREVFNALESSASDLFGDPKSALAGLEDSAVGPMARMFIDALARQCTRDVGDPGSAVSKAIAEIASVGALCGLRQVEEHYRREAKPSSSDAVRGRLFEAQRSADFSVFRVDRNTGTVDSFCPVAKKSGLDDGVDL